MTNDGAAAHSTPWGSKKRVGGGGDVAKEEEARGSVLEKKGAERSL